MTIYGVDARILCGQDVRRSGIWPTDQARIDTFVHEYGGSLEAFPVGNVAIGLRWFAPNAQVVSAVGTTACDAMRRLRQEMGVNDVR